MLLGVLSTVVLSCGWKGCLPEGMWWHQPYYSHWAGHSGQDGLEKGRDPPSMAPSPAEPCSEQRAHQCPHRPHPHDPPARPTSVLPGTPHPAAPGWGPRGVSPSLAQQWDTGAPVSGGTADVPPPAVAQDSCHIPSAETGISTLPTPLHRAWQDLDPQGRHHSPG